ncbi:MAG TPA: hydrolase [Ferrovibrio sp.]|uniref:hydrolase n=1 Tax=Ferrovibrio sp. TaxID=1917215 RepID=UPI002ED45BE3
MQSLDPRSTALVLIDLQKGILRLPIAPHPPEQVVQNATQLAKAFRKAMAPVVLVHVGWSEGFSDTLKQPVDQPFPYPPGGFPPDWMEFAAELEVSPDDIIITKRQWNAFYGTELDLQLRRRGIQTIVLAGIATNIGVESTARAAWEQNYAQVFAEDAMSSFGEDMHSFAMAKIFPRLGRITRTAEVAAAIS